MRVFLRGLLAAVIACGVTAQTFAQAPGSEAAAASNAFGFDLFEQLREQEGNLVVSPSSISLALSMVYAGAEGETKAQMARVLAFDPAMPDGKIHADAAALIAALQFNDEEAGNCLRIANRLWVQQNLPIQPAFVGVTGESYGAELGLADFERNSEAARIEINDWVAENTADKIQDVLPPGSVDEMTRIVLANTLYFLDKWQFPFNEAATSEAPFHLSTESTVECQLMRQVSNFRYGQGEGFQLLEMPYRTNSNISMLILLPEDIDGLAALEAQLSQENLAAWSAQMQLQEVDVALPKFKAESTFSLNDTLGALGMPLAFDERNANFSGITEAQRLFISAVQHKTFIEVDEEGTEAAAATAVVGSNDSVSQSQVFRADRPFLFLIHDSETGAVLFMGRLANPLE